MSAPADDDAALLEIARCERLVQNFYGYLDEKRYDDLCDLFDVDGVWVRLGTELVGRDRIRETMAERSDWLTAHVVTNLRVTLTGPDSAETVQYVTLYRHEGRSPQDGPAPVVLPLGVLRHTDQLVKREGRWLFARKASRALMVDRQRVTHYEQEKGKGT